MLTFAEASCQDLIPLIPTFQGLDEQLQKDIAASCHKLRITPAGQHIIKQDAPPTSAFVIVYGLVQIIRLGDDNLHVGEDNLHAYRGNTQLTGDVSLVDGIPPRHTRITLTECGLLQLDSVDFPRHARRSSELLLRLLTELHEFGDRDSAYRNTMVRCDKEGQVIATMREIAEVIKPPIVTDGPDPYSLSWLKQESFGRSIGVRRQVVSDAIAELVAVEALTGGHHRVPARFIPDGDGRLITCKHNIENQLQIHRSS